VPASRRWRLRSAVSRQPFAHMIYRFVRKVLNGEAGDGRSSAARRDKLRQPPQSFRAASMIYSSLRAGQTRSPMLS
jgi:hypothetical protein